MCDLGFDFANFLNILAGAILGGFVSFAISYYFFVRGKGLDTLLKWLSHHVGEMAITEKFPQFFGRGAVSARPNEPPPENPDVPRLQVVAFPRASVAPGETLEILCRVVDEGFNFHSAAGGLTIVDPRGVRHAVAGEVFGYMRAAIPIPKDEQPGTYPFAFEMHDIDRATKAPKNRFSQTVNVVVS